MFGVQLAVGAGDSGMHHDHWTFIEKKRGQVSSPRGVRISTAQPLDRLPFGLLPDGVRVSTAKPLSLTLERKGLQSIRGPYGLI